MSYCSRNHLRVYKGTIPCYPNYIVSPVLSGTHKIPVQNICLITKKTFYVSIPTIISDDTIEGYRIRKMKVEDGVQKFTDLCAGFTVTLANDITPMPINERQINYQYYIDKANEIINEIN
jgi:hypothetical protein